MSPLLLFAALTGPARATNLKRFRYRALALIDVTAATAGAAVGIGTAPTGIRCQFVDRRTAGSVARCRGPQHASGCRSALVIAPRGFGFGRPLLAFRFLSDGPSSVHLPPCAVRHFLYRALARCAAARRLLGGEKSLCVRPLEMLNPVFINIAFPTLAAKLQHDRIVLRNAYLRGTQMLCTGTFLIYTTMFVITEPLVRLVLGTSWLARGADCPHSFTVFHAAIDRQSGGRPGARYGPGAACFSMECPDVCLNSDCHLGRKFGRPHRRRLDDDRADGHRRDTHVVFSRASMLRRWFCCLPHPDRQAAGHRPRFRHRGCERWSGPDNAADRRHRTRCGVIPSSC